MMTKRLFTFVICLMILTQLWPVKTAHGCSCTIIADGDVMLTEEQRTQFLKDFTDVAFVGRVIYQNPSLPINSWLERKQTTSIVFATNTVYKGSVPRLFKVTTEHHTCGFRFMYGIRYLVLANASETGNGFSTNLCSGNVSMPSNDLLASFGPELTRHLPGVHLSLGFLALLLCLWKVHRKQISTKSSK